jgi:hypothetical protein
MLDGARTMSNRNRDHPNGLKHGAFAQAATLSREDSWRPPPGRRERVSAANDPLETTSLWAKEIGVVEQGDLEPLVRRCDQTSNVRVRSGVPSLPGLQDQIQSCGPPAASARSHQ